MTRASAGLVAAIAGLALAGAALVAACSSADPTAFRLSYELGSYGCSTGPSGCAVPGDTVSSADRGDTIWVYHEIRNLFLGTSFFVTLRPDCAENVAVYRGGLQIDTVPSAVTCRDSTFETIPSDTGVVEARYVRWIVDSALGVGAVRLRGRILVAPVRLEPQFDFGIF
ncbi:MAG: hypothetical protein ACREL9_02865 [Gemmatimonadales bacterium]